MLRDEEIINKMGVTKIEKREAYPVSTKWDLIFGTDKFKESTKGMLDIDRIMNTERMNIIGKEHNQKSQGRQYHEKEITRI